MPITDETTVAELATREPATIKVFERHHIDFCCGGRVSIAQACARQGIEPRVLLDELRQAAVPAGDGETSWCDAPLAALIAHIQRRYHVPLAVELPRLSAMLDKVVDRHGDHLPDVLRPLQATFARLRDELLDHMGKEDAVLFPLITELEASGGASRPGFRWTAIAQPIVVMEAEHASAGEALDTMRALTRGYAPPEWACPTFRGLYYGLAELERDMHVHVHLENHVLFPRAAALAQASQAASAPKA
jgi:regulator of cell morphogenesis and NO signaling